jgi:hypothetical protein
MEREARFRWVVAVAVLLSASCKDSAQPVNPSPGGSGGGAGVGTAGTAGGASGAGGTAGTAGMAGIAGMAGGSATGGMAGMAGMATGGMGAGSGGAGGDAQGGTGGSEPPQDGPGLLPADSVSMNGPYSPMMEQDADGGAGWLFRPSALGENGETHPVLVWGCGSGSTPADYVDHLNRIASHGFVVYAADSSSVTGALLTRGLDWIFAENERSGGELNQKLDLTNVAVGGHSLGSLSTYEIADDPRITNTIHVDGGTFDASGGAKLMKPAVFICGESSTGAPYCEQDYMDANVPIFFTKIMGLSGIQGHIAAAREGLDLWIAWMRWQMAREEERRGDFLDPNCTFCTGKWDSQQKNW